MEAMVIDELPLLEKQLRSEELIDREAAATRLAQAGHDGVRMLAAIAIDANASPASRLTALRHLPADEEAVPVLRLLLNDPLATLRHGALNKVEDARARALIPLIRKLTADPATYWDLDEEIVIGAVASRVLASLSSA